MSRSVWRYTGPLRYEEVESRPGSSLKAEEPAKACGYGPLENVESCVFPNPSASFDFFFVRGNPIFVFRADLSRLVEVGAVVIMVGAWVQLVT